MQQGLIRILVLLCAWQASPAQTITMRVPFEPEWLLINGRQTLIYELYVKNAGKEPVSLTQVAVLNASNSKRLHSIDHHRSLAPGDSTIVYIEMHGVATTTPLIHQVNGFKGALLKKRSLNSLVLGRPLGAGKWAAIYDPSWERGHRRVVYAVNDSARIPGRYAVDFILLNDKGQYAKGNEDSIQNWYGYSVPVLAVANAVVAAVVDTVAESASIAAHGHVDASRSGGNYIALDLGNNRFAFYEHLKPGSIKVKPGTPVQKGQVLAQLGFTGQSTGPHLHFHVANRLSPLGAEGIPYAFESYSLVGYYNTLEQFGKERWNRFAGNTMFNRFNERPGPNNVINFDKNETIVLKGGTVIDVDNYGNSTKDLANAVVVIENGRITAVGRAGTVEEPTGATVINVKGKYIVPGYIEGFGSVTNQAFANAYLYVGVTTVVTAEDNRRGKTFYHASPTPALYKQDAYWGADRISSTKPNQLYENINYRNDAAITHEIDSMAQGGAKVMLIHYGVKKEQLPAILAACKKNRIAPIGELGCTQYADAVKAGIKTFMHTTRYTADLLPDSIRIPYSNAPFGPPSRAYYEYIVQHDVLSTKQWQQLSQLYAQHGVGLMPTASLQVYPYMPWAKNIWQEPAAAIISEKDILHEPLDKATGKPVNPPPIRAKVAPVLFCMDSAFAAKGAHYLTGSGTTAFGTLPGVSLHTEMEMLAHIGLTNRQVLAAATNNFSLLWDWKHIGKIEAGRDADILVLDGDPTKSLACLKQIALLFVKGKQINRPDLLKK